MDERKKNLIYLHIIVVIFGFTGVLGKLISLEREGIVLYRMLIASGTLIVYSLFIKKAIKANARQWLSYCVVGFIIAFHWITFFGAIKASNLSITMATMASTAFFISLIEPMFTKKKFDWKEMVLGLIVIGAIVLMVQKETKFIVGIQLGLLSSFCAALFGTANSIFVKENDSFSISTIELWAGAIGVFVFMWISGSLVPEQLAMSGLDWFWLVLLGVIATAVAFIVSVQVMKVLSPFTVALSINLEPIYAIILAVVIFKEHKDVTGYFFVSATIILAVLFINAYLKSSKRIGKKKV